MTNKDRETDRDGEAYKDGEADRDGEANKGRGTEMKGERQHERHIEIYR